MSLNEHLKQFMEEGVAELNNTLLSNISLCDLPEKKISFLSSPSVTVAYGLSFSSLTLRGLSENKITRAAKLDWRNNSFDFALSFKQITIQAESCLSHHQIKIGGWAKEGGKKRQVALDITNLQVDCVVDYCVDFSEKTFSFIPNVTFDFSAIAIKSPASAVLRALVYVGKSRLKKLLSQKISDQLSTVFATKIALFLKTERETLDKFALAHRLRKFEMREKHGVQGEIPRALQGLDGIGQFPPPKLWQVPEVDVAACTASTIDQLLRNCRTGDLLLFSGMAPSSMRIKKMTQSPFSHVVLIVKEPGLLSGNALCWQATASYHDGVLRNMLNETGIQLNYLEDMIKDYWDECDDAIVVHRQLMQRGQRATLADDSRQKLFDYIKKMDGEQYTEDMEGLYIQGMFEVQNVQGLHYFCSGLVAETLMEIGIISDDFMQHQYTPRDFCNLQKNLSLLDEYNYSENEFIFFNPLKVGHHSL